MKLGVIKQVSCQEIVKICFQATDGAAKFKCLMCKQIYKLHKVSGPSNFMRHLTNAHESSWQKFIEATKSGEALKGAASEGNLLNFSLVKLIPMSTSLSQLKHQQVVQSFRY